MSLAYEEVVDFIALGSTPEQVVAFVPSPATLEHVAELIDRQKTTGLSQDEQIELEEFLQIEHVMRLAKARARQYLAADGR